MKELAKVLCLSGLVLGSVCAWAASGLDVSGTWIMQVESTAGSGTPTFVLQQEGAKVSGTYQGQLGESAVSGSVADNTLTLSFSATTQGVTLNVTYSGMVEGDKISGTMSLGQFGDGTFTGTKE